MNQQQKQEPLEVELKPRVKEFLANLNDFQPEMSVKLIKQIFNEQGVQTSDQNVYKLMALSVDYLIDEMLESISQIKEKKKEEDSNKNQPKKNKTKESKSKEIITTKDIISEIKSKGYDVLEINQYPVFKVQKQLGRN